MKKNLFLLFLFFMTSASFAQKQEKTTPFWGKQEVYLVNQTEKIFRLVDVLLKENMPSVGEPALALYCCWMVFSMIHDWMEARCFQILRMYV